MNIVVESGVVITDMLYPDGTKYISKGDDLHNIDKYYVPSLYVYTHKGSQTVGVVQAFSLEDAKRKIREKSNLTEEPDEIVEVDGDLYEESV